MRKQRVLIGRVTKLTEPRTVYKKVRLLDRNGNPSGIAIATLEVPAGATIVRPKHSDKARTDRAVVLAIEEYGYHAGKKERKRAVNFWAEQPRTWYRVGKVVRPKYGLSLDRHSECESGIHVFLRRRQAEAYG